MRRLLLKFSHESFTQCISFIQPVVVYSPHKISFQSTNLFCYIMGFCQWEIIPAIKLKSNSEPEKHHSAMTYRSGQFSSRFLKSINEQFHAIFIDLNCSFRMSSLFCIILPEPFHVFKQQIILIMLIQNSSSRNFCDREIRPSWKQTTYLDKNVYNEWEVYMKFYVLIY
jgi:hypothetical protein